ncbi:MAG: hypothetical protein EAZ07_08890 [Cytophagales bacterium]|nr:MAG: hypothetical protein EAZ07_08890 [Cytophagales bacterium]
MLPISIGIKVLESLGVLKYLGKMLSPLMNLVGLPGDTGIVWASAMLSNIYGGMIAYAQMGNGIILSEAQITVLTLMMLVAHTFPIELAVAHKSGVRWYVMFMIRFCFALMLGMILNLFNHTFQFGTSKSIQSWIHNEHDATLTLSQWALEELQRYGFIVVVIFVLLLLMKFLKRIGFLDKLSRSLEPILGILGIHASVIPMTVIGLTTGLLYGGALIIKETKEKEIPKLDIFYAMLLMGLCHALIEDTILMVSLGANIFGVLIFRVIFSVLITFGIVRITKLFDSDKMERFLTH